VTGRSGRRSRHEVGLLLGQTPQGIAVPLGRDFLHLTVVVGVLTGVTRSGARIGDRNGREWDPRLQVVVVKLGGGWVGVDSAGPEEDVGNGGLGDRLGGGGSGLRSLAADERAGSFTEHVAQVLAAVVLQQDGLQELIVVHRRNR